MTNQLRPSGVLAAKITKASSKQTFYTILLFADRKRRADAYRAYAYFRWVDDKLDFPELNQSEKISFMWRQREIMQQSCQGIRPASLTPEEEMLFDLVQNNVGDDAGLCSYLDNMMAVMEFDLRRRGRAVSQEDLEAYSHNLAVAVQDALFFFIGHDDPTPQMPGRYHAVTAAHITHLLRDTYEDIEVEYYNIPLELVQKNQVTPQNPESEGYREWVRSRAGLARQYFETGREYIGEVKNLRCRLAGFAYAARFEWVLGAIERDDYRLRRDYSQRKSFFAAVQIFWSTFVSMLKSTLKFKRFEPVPQISIGTNKS